MLGCKVSLSLNFSFALSFALPLPYHFPPLSPPPSLSFSLLNVQGSGEVELPDDRVKLISQQAGQTESDFHTDYQLTTASYAERRAEDMVALEVSREW